MAAPGPENLPVMIPGEATAVRAEQHAQHSRMNYAFITLVALGGEVFEAFTENDPGSEAILGCMVLLGTTCLAGAQVQLDDARARRRQIRQENKDRIGDEAMRSLFRPRWQKSDD